MSLYYEMLFFNLECCVHIEVYYETKNDAYNYQSQVYGNYTKLSESVNGRSHYQSETEDIQKRLRLNVGTTLTTGINMKYLKKCMIAEVQSSGVSLDMPPKCVDVKGDKICQLITSHLAHVICNFNCRIKKPPPRMNEVFKSCLNHI